MKMKMKLSITALMCIMVMASCGKSNKKDESTVTSTPVQSSETTSNISGDVSQYESPIESTSPDNSNENVESLNFVKGFESLQLGDSVSSDSLNKIMNAQFESLFDVPTTDENPDFDNLKVISANENDKSGCKAYLVYEDNGSTDIFGKTIVEREGYNLPETNVTEDMYNKLSVGMSEDDVIEILGTPTLKKSEQYGSKDKSTVFKRYNWWAGNTYDTYKGISVSFENGKINEFHEIGLLPEITPTDDDSYFKLIDAKKDKMYCGMSALEVAALFKVSVTDILKDPYIEGLTKDSFDYESDKYTTSMTIYFRDEAFVRSFSIDDIETNFDKVTPNISEDEADKILADYENGKIKTFKDTGIKSHGYIRRKACGNRYLENSTYSLTQWDIENTNKVLTLEVSNIDGFLGYQTVDLVLVYIDEK